MTPLSTIALENEMDLTLAYKKSIRVGELLKLTISTQTAFATAVSEVCREIIDKGWDGKAVLGTIAEEGRFFMVAHIAGKIDDVFSKGSEGIEYARKLVPVLNINTEQDNVTIELKLGIPRANRLDQRKVNEIKQQLEQEGPISPYEEVKQKNAVLHQINQQKELALVHANFLNEQKNEFLSIVSHELNTPLTVLRSYAQIARRAEDGNNETLAKYLGKIESQSSKIATLIQQLMDISKIEQGTISYQFEAIDMNAYLQEAISNMALIFHTHEVRANLGTDCRLNIDRLRMEQVMNNLIGNAAKYSANGSKITITTAVAGGQFTIHIQDEGIGMSAETLDKVFDKFYRSENVTRKYNGLGMGLYIASRIVQDHQGDIRVQSNEGQGSVFSFSLPLQ